MANEYDIGDTVRLTGTFTDTGGSPADPTTVTIWVKAPTSTVQVYVSGTTGMANPAVGTFHSDYVPPSSGVFSYRIFSTGTIVTAEDGLFRVKTPLVASTGT